MILLAEIRSRIDSIRYNLETGPNPLELEEASAVFGDLLIAYESALTTWNKLLKDKNISNGLLEMYNEEIQDMQSFLFERIKNHST